MSFPFLFLCLAIAILFHLHLVSHIISNTFYISYSPLVSLLWSAAGCYAPCSLCSPPSLGESLEFSLWIPLARYASLSCVVLNQYTLDPPCKNLSVVLNCKVALTDGLLVMNPDLVDRAILHSPNTVQWNWVHNEISARKLLESCVPCKQFQEWCQHPESLVGWKAVSSRSSLVLAEHIWIFCTWHAIFVYLQSHHTLLKLFPKNACVGMALREIEGLHCPICKHTVSHLD